MRALPKNLSSDMFNVNLDLNTNLEQVNRARMHFHSYCWDSCTWVNDLRRCIQRWCHMYLGMDLYTCYGYMLCHEDNRDLIHILDDTLSKDRQRIQADTCRCLHRIVHSRHKEMDCKDRRVCPLERQSNIILEVNEKDPLQSFRLYSITYVVHMVSGNS